jgi:hypothetical protein
VCIKYSKKDYFVRGCGTAQGKPLKFSNRAQSKSILKDNNRIKDIREYTIKYFAFYYNSTYTVYKDAKYGAD